MPQIIPTSNLTTVHSSSLPPVDNGEKGETIIKKADVRDSKDVSGQEEKSSTIGKREILQNPPDVVTELSDKKDKAARISETSDHPVNTANTFVNDSLGTLKKKKEQEEVQPPVTSDSTLQTKVVIEDMDAMLALASGMDPEEEASGTNTPIEGSQNGEVSPTALNKALVEQQSVETHDNPTAVSPPLTPPAFDMGKINTIKNDPINAPDQKVSTQELLEKLIKEIQAQKPGAQIKIKAELAKTNGEFEPEPFHPAGAPDKTYYKTKAQYTIEVEGANPPISVSLERYVYTSATEPESALLAALNYAQLVSELALNSAGLSNNLDGLPTDQKQLDDIKKQRSFEVKIAYNGAGKPTGVTSMLTGAKGEVALKLKKKEEETSSEKYLYVYDKDTGKVGTRKPDDPILEDGKHFYFQTEEQAILNIEHKVKNDDLYDNLEKSQNFEERLKDIQKDIDKKTSDFAELKKGFKKGTTVTDEFKQFIAGLNRDARKDDLSPTRRAYLSKKEELRKHKLAQNDHNAELKILTERKAEVHGSDGKPANPNPSAPGDDLMKLAARLKQDNPDLATVDISNPDTIIDKLILVKETEKAAIDTLKDELKETKLAAAKEQAKITREFNQLQDINRDLTRKLNQLKEALSVANNKLKDPTADHDKANAFIKTFSDKITKLEKQIKENDDLIKELRSLLPQETKEGATAAFNPVSIDVSDSLEDSEILLKGSQEDIAKAADQFKKAIKDNPRNSVALAGYAEALYKQGKTKEAIEYFKRSLKSTPIQLRAVVGYGKILLEQNNLNEAVKYLNAAVQMEDGKNPDVIATLAEALRLQAGSQKDQNADAYKVKLANAAKRFEQALALQNPSNPSTLIGYADVLRDQSALEQDPTVKKSKLEESKKAYQDAFKALSSQAEDLLNNEDFKGAEKQASAALKIKPESVFTLAIYTEALVKQGKFQEAEAPLEKAISLAPDDIQIRELYVKALLEQKKFPKVKEAATQALDLFGEAPVFKEALEKANKGQ